MLGVVTLYAHSAAFIKTLGFLRGSSELHLVSSQIAVRMAGGLVKSPASFTTAPSTVNQQPNYRTNASLRWSARDETDYFITSEGSDENIVTAFQPRDDVSRCPRLEIVLDRLPREPGEARDQYLADQGAQGLCFISARTPADDLNHRLGSPHKLPRLPVESRRT